MKKILKLPLAIKIFIALILGIIAGIALQGYPEIAENYIKPFGTIFLNLLKFIVVPIVLFSIMSGIISMRDIKKVGSIGVKAVIYYFCTTAIAIVIGLIGGNLFKGLFPVLDTGGLVYTPVENTSFMDAIVGMDGPGGPGSGDPIQLGFLAASDNILALDWKCASLVGYNPHNILNLQDALERGIWLKDPAEITTSGAAEEDCRCNTFRIVRGSTTLQKEMPGIINFLATTILTKTPHFIARKCQKCRRCEQICPAHVIKMDGADSTARLTDKVKCLHCFCCHEICPAGAIKLRRF